jgi:hypothetical protein
MILHKHLIPGDETEVTICPLGDIQWAGDREDIAYDHLQEHIAWCLSQPNPLFVGMGDYIDFASPSNREALAQARTYDTAKKVIAGATNALVDDVFEKVLKPTAGRWLGLVEGHHHFRTKEGEHSDAYLARKLRTRFLEEMGVVNLKFGRAGSLNIVVFHGEGQSVFPWGPLVKLYRIAPNFNAALFLMGHQTKKAVGEFDFIDAEFPEDAKPYLAHKTRHLVGTGGWGKGYIDGRPTYVSRNLYNPVALGQPIVHVRPRYRTSTTTGVKRWEPRITVES